MKKSLLSAVALTAMVVSAVAPLLWFRKKGWL